MFWFDLEPDFRMNADCQRLCEKLIPSAYVQQGVQARRTRENLIRHLLEQVSGDGARRHPPLPRAGTGVAAGASLHPEGSLADSEASHWSDVCNLDPNPFTDWE